MLCIIVIWSFFFFLMIRRPPRSTRTDTLFPYTTLFRSLGMLTCIRRCFDLIGHHRGVRHSLAAIPSDDAATWAMIQRADTLGVFQIESRAQMSMLPRLKPANFYDLVIEVRSEARRVGKECVSTCRSRWSPAH